MWTPDDPEEYARRARRAFGQRSNWEPEHVNCRSTMEPLVRANDGMVGTGVYDRMIEWLVFDSLRSGVPEIESYSAAQGAFRVDRFGRPTGVQKDVRLEPPKK